jgi:hypothetical protein
MKILSDSSKTSDLMIIITLMHLQIDPISFMTTELTKYKKKNFGCSIPGYGMGRYETFFLSSCMDFMRIKAVNYKSCSKV